MDSGGTPNTGARIGPNAILQLLPVLDRRLGRTGRDRLLQGIALPPSDAGMWPEETCCAAHLAVWQGLPNAATVLAEAGQGTADYILAHRIPGLAKWLIRTLPAPLGARLLTAAITRHAWTFAGSGQFRVASRSPLVFEVAQCPMAFGGHWHAAVFQGLYRELVWPKAFVVTSEDGSVRRFAVNPQG
jgi:divinyl protochlorophyllide a 8-vinyl-reductase